MIKLTLSLIVLIITYFLIFTNRRIREQPLPFLGQF